MNIANFAHGNTFVASSRPPRPHSKILYFVDEFEKYRIATIVVISNGEGLTLFKDAVSVMRVCNDL